MPKITFTPPGHAPVKYRLDKETVKVGRAVDCDAQIAFGGVSNHHAEMRQTRNGYVVIDNGSTNGIKQDDKLVQAVKLEHGSKFSVGDVEAFFELYPDELESVEAGDELFPDAPEADELIAKVEKEKSKKGDGPPPPPPPDDEVGPPPPPPPDALDPPLPPPGGLDIDDDDDDDLLPPPPDEADDKPRKLPGEDKKVSQGGTGMFVFLCVLVAIFAIGIGLTVRHYKETGGFLLFDVFKRTKVINE